MTRTQILDAFDRIRVWQQGDKRAPHKPLLVLLALALWLLLLARRVLKRLFGAKAAPQP